MMILRGAVYGGVSAPLWPWTIHIRMHRIVDGDQASSKTALM